MSPGSLFLPTQLAGSPSADRRHLPVAGAWAGVCSGFSLGLLSPQRCLGRPPTPGFSGHQVLQHLAFLSFTSTEPSAYLTSPLGCPQAPEPQSIQNTLSTSSQSSSPSCWSCPPSALPPNPGGHRDLPPPLSLHVLSHDIRSHPFHYLSMSLFLPTPALTTPHLFLPGPGHQHPSWPCSCCPSADRPPRSPCLTGLPAVPQGWLLAPEMWPV